MSSDSSSAEKTLMEAGHQPVTETTLQVVSDATPAASAVASAQFTPRFDEKKLPDLMNAYKNIPSEYDYAAYLQQALFLIAFTNPSLGNFNLEKTLGLLNAQNVSSVKKWAKAKDGEPNAKFAEMVRSVIAIRFMHPDLIQNWRLEPEYDLALQDLGLRPRAQIQNFAMNGTGLVREKPLDPKLRAEEVAAALAEMLVPNEEGKVIFGVRNEPLYVSQLENLHAAGTEIANGTDLMHGVQPGGSGKTRVCNVLAAAMDKTGRNTLYVCPGQQALEDFVEESRILTPDLKVGAVHQGEKTIGRYTFITYASLLRRVLGEDNIPESVKEQLKIDAEVERYYHENVPLPPNKLRINPNLFDLVIWDEAHNYLTPTAQELLELFRHAINIGMDATPRYYEGKEVALYFGKKYELPWELAEARGEVCYTVNAVINTNLITGIRLDSPEQEESKQVAKALNRPDRNKILAEMYIKGKVTGEKNGEKIELVIAGEKVMAFVASIEHAGDAARDINEILMPALQNDDEFRQTLREKGIDPDTVEVGAMAHHTGGRGKYEAMSRDQRKAAIADYDSRKALILVTTRGLQQSFDNRGTTIVADLIPRQTFVGAGQAGMRATRPNEGKSMAVVFNFEDADHQSSVTFDDFRGSRGYEEGVIIEIGQTVAKGAQPKEGDKEAKTKGVASYKILTPKELKERAEKRAAEESNVFRVQSDHQYITTEGYGHLNQLMRNMTSGDQQAIGSFMEAVMPWTQSIAGDLTKQLFSPKQAKRLETEIHDAVIETLMGITQSVRSGAVTMWGRFQSRFIKQLNSNLQPLIPTKVASDTDYVQWPLAVKPLKRASAYKINLEEDAHQRDPDSILFRGLSRLDNDARTAVLEHTYRQRDAEEVAAQMGLTLRNFWKVADRGMGALQSPASIEIPVDKEKIASMARSLPSLGEIYQRILEAKQVIKGKFEGINIEDPDLEQAIKIIIDEKGVQLAQLSSVLNMETYDGLMGVLASAPAEGSRDLDALWTLQALLQDFELRKAFNTLERRKAAFGLAMPVEVPRNVDKMTMDELRACIRSTGSIYGVSLSESETTQGFQSLEEVRAAILKVNDSAEVVKIADAVVNAFQASTQKRVMRVDIPLKKDSGYDKDSFSMAIKRLKNCSPYEYSVEIAWPSELKRILEDKNVEAPWGYEGVALSRKWPTSGERFAIPVNAITAVCKVFGRDIDPASVVEACYNNRDEYGRSSMTLFKNQWAKVEISADSSTTPSPREIDEAKKAKSKRDFQYRLENGHITGPATAHQYYKNSYVAGGLKIEITPDWSKKYDANARKGILYLASLVGEALTEARKLDLAPSVQILETSEKFWEFIEKDGYIGDDVPDPIEIKTVSCKPEIKIDPLMEAIASNNMEAVREAIANIGGRKTRSTITISYNKWNSGGGFYEELETSFQAPLSLHDRINFPVFYGEAPPNWTVVGQGDWRGPVRLAEGSNALLLALHKASPEIIQLLLDKGAGFPAYKNERAIKAHARVPNEVLSKASYVYEMFKRLMEVGGKFEEYDYDGNPLQGISTAFSFCAKTLASTTEWLSSERKRLSLGDAGVATRMRELEQRITNMNSIIRALDGRGFAYGSIAPYESGRRSPHGMLDIAIRYGLPEVVQCILENHPDIPWDKEVEVCGETGYSRKKIPYIEKLLYELQKPASSNFNDTGYDTDLYCWYDHSLNKRAIFGLLVAAGGKKVLTAARNGLQGYLREYTVMSSEFWKAAHKNSEVLEWAAKDSSLETRGAFMRSLELDEHEEHRMQKIKRRAQKKMASLGLSVD